MIKNNHARNTRNNSFNHFVKVFNASFFLLNSLMHLSYANESFKGEISESTAQEILSINLWAPSLKGGDEDLEDLEEPSEASVTVLDVLHMNDEDRFDFNYKHNKLFQAPHSNEMWKIIHYLSSSTDQTEVKAQLLRDFGGRLEDCVRRARPITNPTVLENKRFYSELCAECYLRSALMGNKSAAAVIQLDAKALNLKENYVSVLHKLSLEKIPTNTAVYQEYLHTIQKAACHRHKWDQNWIK